MTRSNDLVVPMFFGGLYVGFSVVMTRSNDDFIIRKEDILQLLSFIMNVKNLCLGKTGTAQKFGEDGRYMDGNYFFSFMGASPMNNPEIACYIAIDNPKIQFYMVM